MTAPGPLAARILAGRITEARELLASIPEEGDVDYPAITGRLEITLKFLADAAETVLTTEGRSL